MVLFSVPAHTTVFIVTLAGWPVAGDGAGGCLNLYTALQRFFTL